MELTNEKKTKFLSMVTLFASLSGMELNRLSEVAHLHCYEKYQNIVKEGEEGDAMFILVSGQVKITRKQGQNESMIAIMGEGDTFGELALFDSEPRSASVIALKDSCLLSITREQFKELIRMNPEIALAMMRILSKRLRDTTTAFSSWQS